MKDFERKFWPYKPMVSIISAYIIFIVLVIITAVLNSTNQWPPDASAGSVFLGILLLSLLPVLLSILNVVIDKGGSIGYKDFKLDFGKIQQSASTGFTIPSNIGLPGMAITDSGTTNIIETLSRATSSGIVVVDLEDGHAWWETRLLVLVSGAERLGKPDKIVFVASEEGRQRVFQGWGKPGDLLQQLLKENQQYLKSYYDSRAAARQCEIYGPLDMNPPATYFQIPAPPLWMQSRLAVTHSWMAFSTQTGLPNELLAEQYLQNELGNEIEQKPEGSKHINIVRLNEIFKPVLIRQTIDLTWPNDKQTHALFSGDTEYKTITRNGSYSAMVSKQVLLNEALKSLFIKQN